MHGQQQKKTLLTAYKNNTHKRTQSLGIAGLRFCALWTQYTLHANLRFVYLDLFHNTVKHVFKHARINNLYLTENF